MNSKDIQLSKSLSWLLRHGAVKEGFDLSPEGYIEVDKILQHKSFKHYSCSDIKRVVRDNEKQRFGLRTNPDTGAVEIKAHQGHSIYKVTDAELIPILTAKYKTVVHGTYTKCWPQIIQNGLSRMTRRHIHLAKGLNTDRKVISGLRNSAQILIYIDLSKALEDGIKFYESENGVILTPGNDNGFLESKYFDSVVEVSTGYPPYTKPQDLAHAFCQFGSVRLNHEWVTDSAACLEFTEPEHAQAAIRASRSVNLYGAFLTVSPCTAATRPQRQRRGDPRRPKGPNFKGTIVEPADIPLQGAFHQQLDALLSAVRLTQPEIERITQLYRDLEYVLGELWPGCRAIPFGSVTTGLGVKSSDADCFVLLPSAAGPAARAGAVARARRALAQHPGVFADLLAIPQANTPIVKFRHLPTGVFCDVSFKTALGSQNSKLIAFLLFLDPRLIPVAVAVKYWARAHELTGTGKLTNYALTMMLVFYFQRPPLAILPAVEWLQRDRACDCFVDYWNTGFMCDARRVPRSADASSIAQLLGGFFEFYADFDFERLAVCPFLGRPIAKDDFKDPRSLPEEFGLYKRNVCGLVSQPIRHATAMCVQDPFEQCHNVASAVSARLAADIRAYFRFAAEAAQREKLKDYSGFLRTILLEKPVLPRARKSSSEFRARLPPGIVANITAEDWKAAVRDVVFQVFETILRVELKKVEESETEETVKPKKTGKPESNKGRKASNPVAVTPGSSEANEIAKPEVSIPKETDKDGVESENTSKLKKDIPKSEDTTKQKDRPSENTPNSVIAAPIPVKTDQSEEINGEGKENVNTRTEGKSSSDSKEKLKVNVVKNGRVIGGIARREKERYTGEVTRAIWKRKLFSKLYSVMGLKFVDRETMITDEIMKADKNVIDVQFQLLLTLVNAPRAAAVSVRHAGGDLNAFKEFGKFFNNTFQHWFLVLYKPYCGKPQPPLVGNSRPTANDEESAAKELQDVMKGEETDSDSDSDSTLSYEDERIDPNATNSEDVGESTKLQSDTDKNSKNESNSAVTQSEISKRSGTKEKHDKVRTDELHDESELSPSGRSPRKRKNKTQRPDKNENPIPIDHLNDRVEALNLSDQSPRNKNNMQRSDKNAHQKQTVDDQNEGSESQNTSNKSAQRSRNRTQHGDHNEASQQVAKSKPPRQRHRKGKDKPSAPLAAENVPLH